MKYLSVCSGIEAATVAWHSLGWEALAFSEIDKFPRKVLEHHYPDVPLHGDFTLLREHDWIKNADVLVGGTPCQAFSVAGLRNSLDDDRGNLTLEFVRLADAIDDLRPIGHGTVIVWENVPGVLSVKDNAFGCFLGAIVGNDAPLVPTGGKWTNAGMVVGPKRRAAWRVLDAQYFGVAQRRRRVFVVASARDGFDPAEVLFEREGLRRDTPPSREQGQEVAATIAARFGISRNNHEECVSMTLQSRMGTAGFDLDTETPVVQVFDRQRSDEYGEADIASTMRSRDYKDVTDLVAQPMAFQQNTRDEVRYINGDGQIVGALAADSGMKQTNYIAQPVPFGVGENPDLSHCLRSGASKADKHESTTYVAQPIPDIVGALSCNSGPNGHDAGNFACNQAVDAGHVIAQPMAYLSAGGVVRPLDNVMSTLDSAGESRGTNQQRFIHQEMAIRRLTPRECERLQGFPDDYTAIPNAADGPRYKALGNSMAVPVMAWIGKRINKHMR